MNEARRGDAFWSARLASLATLTHADAIAIVLVMRDGTLATYVEHNLAAPGGWERTAGDGAIQRAIAQRTVAPAPAELPLSDGRVARSLCAAPISWQDAVIGALVVVRESRPFEGDDVEQLRKTAELAAIELAEASALWQAQQLSVSLTSREKLRADMRQELAQASDANAVLETATRRLAEIFSADGVSMMMIDPAGDLVTRAAIGEREDVVRRAKRKVGEGISGWVAKQGQPLLLQGKVEDRQRGFTGVDPSIGGALVAPIKSEDRVVGVVNVKASAGKAAYGESHLRDLTSVAEDVATALQRADRLQRVEEDRRQAIVLFELSRLAMQGGDAQADLETAGAMLADTLHCQVLGVWIAASDTEIRLQTGQGYGDVLPPNIAMEKDSALASVFGERRTRRVTLEAIRPLWASPRAIAYALAPIVAADRAIGVLVLGRSMGGFDDADLAFATTLGDYLGALVRRTSSTDALQESAAAERRRIAQELHDGLAQELTGVVLALEGCQRALERDPEVLPTQLAKAARDARACLTEIRQYMAALRQQDPAALTLPVTVSRIVEDVRKTTGLAIELEELGTERALLPQQERAVVRIAQEALQNVARHAHASRAKVILNFEEDGVTLSIEDDGEGFSVGDTLGGAEQAGRFGLLGMTERAESVGGSLAVRSERSQGTLVQARLPYAAAPRLAAVASWPGAPHPIDEVPPQAIEDVEEIGERAGRFLGRLFGR